uniref:Clusterin-associated protein 1 n=1 Tax=Parascaris equorum TaxID=6256 RepID=A0A914RNK8_PAREQ
MSYRELRNVVEMMRALGYPRILSMENFRTPNFKLVAELLEWIVRSYVHFVTFMLLVYLQKKQKLAAAFRFDPNSRLPAIVDTEQERADGYAVQELAVVVRLLYDTTKQPLDAEGGVAAWNAMRSKVQEVHECRQLASEISQSGATLYDLLAKELIAAVCSHRLSSLPPACGHRFRLSSNVSLQEARSKALSFSLDLAALDGKIERKKREYEQQQKRLAKLQSFRPQYMDEYEKYEKKLKHLYAIYVLKFRNVAYLQQLQRKHKRIHASPQSVSEFDKAERQRNAEAEQSMRNMVERMRTEELALRNTQLAEFGAEEEGESRPTRKGCFAQISIQRFSTVYKVP